MLGNPLLLGDDGYQISRSVRLRSSASAYFNRTPASAGNRKTWTWSAWVKRGSLGSAQWLFAAGPISTDYTLIRFGSGGSANDFLEYVRVVGSAIDAQKISSAVYRDTSAWYHIVVAEDAANTVARVYVNGSEISYSTNDNPSNVNGAINNNVSHEIGRYVGSALAQFDGYLTEINFIDGQALTPSSFGETDAITGVWKPKKYAGTYGTNGFYLNFSDPSAATAAAIGKDYSGNGNNWTPNNISVTAGATYDSMLDVPTPWADGGNGRGNYAVLNPLAVSASTATMSNGNLTATGIVAGGGNAFATIALPSSGKFYWEITPTSLSGNGMIGVGTISASSSYFWQNTDGSLAYYSANGNRYLNNAAVAYGATYAANDVIGVAADIDAGTVTFYKNNVSQGAITFNAAGLFPALADGSGSFASNFNANFGQRPFTYTPPSGFKALNTQNLPEPTIKKGNQYFDATTYTGTGATQSIVNSGAMQPDLVILKSRSYVDSHYVLDSIRGGSAWLQTNSTAAEGSGAVINSFNNNGFTVSTSTGVNTNAATYVGWQWKEGATQGFDIVTYTGNGANRTVAHSLGVAPRMIIVKSRSNGSYNWSVYHANLTNANYVIYLDATNAQGSEPTAWNGTAPTSSVFSLGTSAQTNLNGATYVAYLFSEVAGFSRFGSYSGNGSADGPFVFCGFRPRYVMVKRTDASDSWVVEDTARSTTNVVDEALYPNLSNIESVNEPLVAVDVLSNGFKLRNTLAAMNANGGTYIFAAFAENPFKYSLAR